MRTRIAIIGAMVVFAATVAQGLVTRGGGATSARKVEDAVRKDKEQLFKSAGVTGATVNASCKRASRHNWRCTIHSQVAGVPITTHK